MEFQSSTWQSEKLVFADSDINLTSELLLAMTARPPPLFIDLFDV